MDINKRLQQKHKRRAMENRIEDICRKLATPLIKLEKHLREKEDNKRELLRELGRNMNMDEAVEIAIKLIADNLIKRERDVAFVVAEYGDYDYGVYTVLKWLLKHISCNKNKEQYKLMYYLWKHETYSKDDLEFNREFTQAIYDKIISYKGLKVEWIVDKEKYGYWKSGGYEKTLIIGLEDK